MPKYYEIKSFLENYSATLVAVSKTKPAEAIEALYAAGQRDFGENYVLELVDKAASLPKDINWHFIGHLQTNKVKYIAPFVYLIHGVDSLKLLQEINKQALKNNRVIDCLLQIHIATEETKFGFDISEVESINWQHLAELSGVRVRGFMGMASFTDNEAQIQREFQTLVTCFKAAQINQKDLSILSMGMSGDYALALEKGSNMVRVGSLLFGARS
ncbi:MAG: YggS family pyridoxal phosphate-dependent enzyme [Chitinophagaceae bacterium]